MFNPNAFTRVKARYLPNWAKNLGSSKFDGGSYDMPYVLFGCYSQLGYCGFIHPSASFKCRDSLFLRENPYFLQRQLNCLTVLGKAWAWCCLPSKGRSKCRYKCDFVHFKVVLNLSLCYPTLFISLHYALHA